MTAVVAPARDADAGVVAWRRALVCCPCVFRARKPVAALADVYAETPSPLILHIQQPLLTIHDLNKFNNNENEGPRIPQLSFPVISLNKNDSSDSTKDEDVPDFKQQYNSVTQQQTEHFTVTIKTVEPEPEMFNEYESDTSPQSSEDKFESVNVQNASTEAINYINEPENEDEHDDYSDKSDTNSQHSNENYVLNHKMSRSNSAESLESNRSNSVESEPSDRNYEDQTENVNENTSNLTIPSSPSNSNNSSEIAITPRSHASNISVSHSPERQENTFTSAAASPVPSEKEIDKVLQVDSPKKVLPINGLRKVSLTSAKTREQMIKCTTLLESKEWENIMSGLKYVYLLLGDPQPQINSWRAIIRNISSHVRNLRSQVARAACNTSGSVFECYGKLLENEAEDLVVALLDRTADTNRFLRADAAEALEKICANISSSKALSLILIKGCSHRSGVVRGASAQLLVAIVSKAGASRTLSSPRDLRDRLLRTNVDLLMDATPDTRARAKDLMQLLSTDEHFYAFLKESISQSKFKSIEKTVKFIRSR